MKTSTRIPVPGTYNFRDVGGLPARHGHGCATACCSAPTGCTDSARPAVPSCASWASASSSTCATRTRRGSCPTTSTGSTSRCCGLPGVRGLGCLAGRRRHLARRPLRAHRHPARVRRRERAARDRERGRALGGRALHRRQGPHRHRRGARALAVGVDREAVIEDYARTEANLAGEWLEEMVALVGRYGVPDTPELRVLMGGSPREAIEGVLDTVERAHGIHARVPARGGARRSHDLAALERAADRRRRLSRRADAASERYRRARP